MLNNKKRDLLLREESRQIVNPFSKESEI